MAAVVEQEPKTYPCGNCPCDSEGRHPFETWTIPGVIERTSVCPRQLITPYSRFFMDLYRHYKNGVLPVSGGLLDQPYSYFRAMTIIDRWTGNG